MISSSMHPSGLQTSQYNREPNPLQRHLNNKASLERFYQQIATGINSQAKLQKLNDVQFVNWYKKTRYWSACKYVSNEEDNEEFQLTKIKVSNRQFAQIMKDNKEIDFDLRSAFAVVLQPKSHHKYVIDTIQLSKEIERQYEAQNNRPYLQQLKLVHDNYRWSFGIFTRWHFENAECRIVVLVKDKLDKDKMLFIYNKESQQNQPINQSRMALSYFQNNDRQATSMKEIIKCHHCKQSNQKLLGRFKQIFSETVKNDFKRKIHDILDTERRSENRLTGNMRLMECFRQYDRFQSEDMIKRWKALSAQKSKEKILMVEVSEIWIRKAGNLKFVNLNIKNFRKEQKEENYNKRYVYNRVQGQYSVYIVSNEQVSRCSAFELVKGAFSKELSLKVDFVNQSNTHQSFFNNYTYFKSEGVDAFSHIISLLDSSKEYGNNDQTCSIVLKTKETRNTSLKSVELHHQRVLFDQVGQIPTKYRSSLQLNYSPDTYPTIRLLLAPHLPQKLTKNSYQLCYFNLVQFIQSEENKSQLSLASLTSANAVDKCPMKERLSFYERQILKGIGDIDVNTILKGSPIIHESRKVITAQQNKLIAYLSILDQRMFTELCGREFTLNQVLYKNLQEDLAHYKPLNEVLVNQLLVKFLHFTNRVPKIRQFGYQLRYTSSLIPILEKYILIFFNSRQTADDEVANQNKNVVHFFVFVLFIARVYSYSELTNLRNDLFILRHLVRERLPYYNDFLNRSNIGLENLIGPHLLNLFTDLSEELTFRIWDFLIFSDNIFKARIVVAFTLLTYFQATRNLPIIPINQFMQKVYQNHHKINITIDFARRMEKSAEAYFASEQNKSKKLQKLVEGKEKTIVSDKYLQRIILGETFSNAEKQQRVEKHYQNNRSVQSLKEIAYPLPRPNYFGYPINQIVLFIHNLNILDNINLMAQKYSLRFTIPQAKSNSIVQIPIANKNHFYNQSFKVPLHPITEDRPERQQSRTITIEVVKKGAETVELSGKLNYSHYHKDKAYKAIVVLTAKAKHNKGQTVLNLSFCLKSSQYNKKQEERNLIPLQKLSQQVLDYDMGENNEVMMALRQLHENFEQIKNPLDQFSTEQNRKLKNSAINVFDYSWLQNSKSTVEEVKAIFYHIFPQEKEQDLKLQFSKIYQIFSAEHRMQHVYLAEVLTRLVLSLNITRKKKLTYLYCLGVHYQNAYTKTITAETINSMIRLILRQKEIVTACPYEIQTCGKIVEASFFRSSLKSQEEKNDFTQILQDWAYICTYKFEFNAIILGSATNLSVLKALFDQSTLRVIESQPQCRFQIIYEVDGKKYLWSAVVDSRTFNIVKRGTKFLNTFDGYSDIKYLDSTQEYLYNCENIIPLQAHKTYNYAQFTQVMLQNQLVRYALQMPSNLAKEPVKYEQVRPKDATEDSRSSNMYADNRSRNRLDMMVIELEEEVTYDSWALHRSQNCLENWRKCCILNPGPVLSEIRYADDPQLYTVSTLDLISMDEIDLQREQTMTQIQ